MSCFFVCVFVSAPTRKCTVFFHFALIYGACFFMDRLILFHATTACLLFRICSIQLQQNCFHVLFFFISQLVPLSQSVGRLFVT